MKGHALAAENGIPSLFRRVYHNPDGYERAGEFDFVTYFECDDESLPVFDQRDDVAARRAPEPRVALRRRRTRSGEDDGSCCVSESEGQCATAFRCSRRMSRPKSPLKSRHTECT